MSLHGYPRATTPWIDKLFPSPNWMKFDRAYSSHTHTVPTLSLALTAANQYNGRAYYRSPSLIDVAKAAGFGTLWLSNQQGLGRWDNPVSVIAGASDIYLKINLNVGRSVDSHYYDSELVERFRALRSSIDGSRNNLIVFHLMGSHQDYCRRYPPEFERFGQPRDAGGTAGRVLVPVVVTPTRRIDCYDSSIAFTDHVLSRLFDEARRLPGLKAFVYLSDHAEDVLGGRAHDAQLFTFDMTRIPLLVWLSDKFIADEPERARSLRNRQATVWTNDLLYDLMLGLMGIGTDDAEPNRDLSSSSYDLDEQAALTLHGARRVADDMGPGTRR